MKTCKKNSVSGTKRNTIKTTGLNDCVCFFEKKLPAFLAEICHCDEKKCRAER
jgi:hypothetical protein